LGIVSITDILTKSDFVEQPKETFFEQEIKQAIVEARRICEDENKIAQDCIAAWEMVEDLQAEAAHQLDQKLEKTALEEYLEENPEFADNLMLDNWCSG